MAVEISGVTLCPSDDLIPAACLDYPQTGPVDGYALEVIGWIASKAPVAEVQFLHEGIVVARCELDYFTARRGQDVWHYVTRGVLEGNRNGRPRTGIHH